MASVTDLRKLKVSELRDELARRSLDTKGVKDDLVQRLADAMEADAQDGGNGAALARGDGAEAQPPTETSPAQDLVRGGASGCAVREPRPPLNLSMH